MSFNQNETRAFWEAFPEGTSIHELRVMKLLGETDQRSFIEPLTAPSKPEAATAGEVAGEVLTYVGDIILKATA